MRSSHQARCSSSSRHELVGCVLEILAQNGLQLARAVLLEALAQPVHTQHALLTDRPIDLMGMKRIFGREAASQIAAASLASFLPLAPSMR